MKTFTLARAAQAALIAAAIGGASTAALADIKDYKFELVDQTVQAGPDKVITVRLVNTKTGKPVPDAVIFATRLDMAPDGMQEMVTKVTPMPGAEPGTYRFKATLRHGRPLAAFARRQGPGRDRHRREQARHHGAEMNRAVAASAAAALIAVAGIAFVVAGPQRPAAPAIAMIGPAAAEEGRAPIYYPGSGRQAVVLADAEEDAGRSRLSRRARRRRRQLRRRRSVGDAVGIGGAGRLRRAPDQILPQSHGPAGHVADAEEGFHGDGLHPRLRRRRQRRRVRQAVARARSSAPA